MSTSLSPSLSDDESIPEDRFLTEVLGTRIRKERRPRLYNLVDNISLSPLVLYEVPSNNGNLRN